MSRLTGKEVYSLMEAYQQVYAPRELTEEQVWEGVENWVHSLLEEGYDLSDYTWEEMYEQYLNEGLLDDVKTDMRNSAAQKTVNKALSGGPTPYKSSSDGKNYKNYNDALAAKNSRDPQGTQGRQAQDDLNRVYKAGGGDAAVRGGPKLGGLLNVPGKSPIDVMSQGSKNLPAKYPRPGTAPAPGAPAPGAPAPGAPAPGARPSAPGPAASRPPMSAPGAKPDATKTLPTKPMGGDPMDQWARANPTLAAKVKPGQSGYNTIRTRLDADNDRQENYDAYDLVLSHLIDEGYANTEEAALTIMANMSEEWRESIVEEVFDEARKADKLGYERGTAANPNIRNISLSDLSQRTMLNSKVRRRADEMGRERRNSPKYKQGARPSLSAKEKSFLKFADRSSPTSGNPRNPNVQDTGSQTTWPSQRRAQKDPKQNPKHNANRDNDK